MTRTDVSASTLNVDELTALKDDLDLLHASVTERISTLIQEREALINWSSEANKKDKPLVMFLVSVSEVDLATSCRQISVYSLWI